jgi:hypothetical protein
LDNGSNGNKQEGTAKHQDNHSLGNLCDQNEHTSQEHFLYILTVKLNPPSS